MKHIFKVYELSEKSTLHTAGVPCTIGLVFTQPVSPTP